MASDEVAGGVLRALAEKEVEVGDGLPFEITDGFLPAEEVALSGMGLGAVVEDGLADPV